MSHLIQSILYVPCVVSLAQFLVLKLWEILTLKAVLFLTPIPSPKLELGKEKEKIGEF